MTPSLRQHPFLLVLGWLLAAAAGFAAVPAPETYTYKRVGALEIKADVYRPAGNAAKPRPVIVYFHGGSLINGKRQAVDDHPLLAAALDAGYVLVSLDYRLAPETKLAGLVADIEDGYRWVREQGPARFGIDPDRVAVAGGSAGGYLTLLAGHRFSPRPRVLFAEMGYCDILGEWQMKPSVHRPHYEDSNLGEAEAWRQVSGPPIANVADRAGDGSAFNDFIRRQARWPKAVTGWDPLTEADKYLPYLPLRNVTADYPPTVMVHGEKDSDVPVSQPRAMAAELARHGVEHQLLIIPNAEHGNRNAARADVAAAHAAAFAFLRRHLD